MRNFIALAALAATTAFAAPAAAQSTTGPSSDTIKVEALLIQPATLQALDDLSFGTIVAAANGSGTVTIDPDTGARSITVGGGTLTGSTTAPGQRGRFIGNGLPLQDVVISAVFPSFLNNADDLTKTVPFTGTLDSDSSVGTINTGATGVFYVGVGGSITIASAQMPGLYTGEVTVTADFQ